MQSTAFGILSSTLPGIAWIFFCVTEMFLLILHIAICVFVCMCALGYTHSALDLMISIKAGKLRKQESFGCQELSLLLMGNTTDSWKPVNAILPLVKGELLWVSFLCFPHSLGWSVSFVTVCLLLHSFMGCWTSHHAKKWRTGIKEEQSPISQVPAG